MPSAWFRLIVVPLVGIPLDKGGPRSRANEMQCVFVTYFF